MNIYFLESNKIYTFKLPLEITGSYILSDYDEYGNKRSLVSVEASSGKWVIKDNDEVKIFYNSAYNKEAILEYYNFYQLVGYLASRTKHPQKSGKNWYKLGIKGI